MGTLQRSVVERALGDEWPKLAPVIRRHYGISPSGGVVMTGRMQVRFPRRIAPMVVLGRVFGALVHRRGEDIAVEVTNAFEGEAMIWRRVFRFSDGRVVTFSSRMCHAGGNEIIEFVRFGLGVRMALSQENGALLFSGRGYVWQIGPLRLKLPGWLFLGADRTCETPLSETEFEVDFTIDHRLWGRTYNYGGRFSLRRCGHRSGWR